ncbi:hypothetical protein MUG91_G233n3 [Manis pentadactyla]|nr:hypothetical protein MUG91_G233n3 [Manis pentadactyla]
MYDSYWRQFKYSEKESFVFGHIVGFFEEKLRIIDPLLKADLMNSEENKWVAAQFPKAPDPWSKEAVLLDLQRWKRRRRTVEEEEDQTSAAGQEEEDKRRVLLVGCAALQEEADTNGNSLQESEATQDVMGWWCGPLKSSLSSQSSDGELHERPSTSVVSCLKGTCTCGIHMSSRNAISSSYSSTRGISQLWKRRRSSPSASPFSSPALIASQTQERPAKKIREEDVSQEAGSSTPPVDKESQGEQETASSSITESPPATPPASTLAVPAAWTAASSASPPAPLTIPQFLKNNIFLKNPNPLGLPSFPAADSTQKPVFGFGASSVTSTASSMTSSTASTAQPALFGAPLAPGASSTPAMGSILQFGKALATPAPTTAMTFGQSLPGAVQTAAGSSTASFGGFGGTLTTFTPVAPSQPALTFSSTATPAFNIPFGSGTRPPIPSYPEVTPQPMFWATDRQQMGAAKPALAPSFGSSFPFGRSAVPAPP